MALKRSVIPVSVGRNAWDGGCHTFVGAAEMSPNKPTRQLSHPGCRLRSFPTSSADGGAAGPSRGWAHRDCWCRCWVGSLVSPVLAPAPGLCTKFARPVGLMPPELISIHSQLWFDSTKRFSQ